MRAQNDDRQPNEIKLFHATQNEYSDWSTPDDDEASSFPLRQLRSTSLALTDKLLASPLSAAADWANRSGFETFFYVYGKGRGSDDEYQVRTKGMELIFMIVFEYVLIH